MTILVIKTYFLEKRILSYFISLCKKGSKYDQTFIHFENFNKFEELITAIQDEQLFNHYNKIYVDMFNYNSCLEVINKKEYYSKNYQKYVKDLYPDIGSSLSLKNLINNKNYYVSYIYSDLIDHYIKKIEELKVQTRIGIIEHFNYFNNNLKHFKISKYNIIIAKDEIFEFIRVENAIISDYYFGLLTEGFTLENLIKDAIINQEEVILCSNYNLYKEISNEYKKYKIEFAEYTQDFKNLEKKIITNF